MQKGGGGQDPGVRVSERRKVAPPPPAVNATHDGVMRLP
eukprot:CAMPEP_0114132388 /NCGR_PEP_ID=MMETSP0043_2-20121206/13068_1 /TAXON_ID=464988 /ORGANISM="Hemiselmis andersenii, Strain CCMP644" /LENGTH=38 /DNA_ID= /DNA_START= /DNA_END= /DNA_ORIENTATION=